MPGHIDLHTVSPEVDVSVARGFWIGRVQEDRYRFIRLMCVR